MVICLEQGAHCLHMVQLMPLPSQSPIISGLRDDVCVCAQQKQLCRLLPRLMLVLVVVVVVVVVVLVL